MSSCRPTIKRHISAKAMSTPVSVYLRIRPHLQQWCITEHLVTSVVMVPIQMIINFRLLYIKNKHCYTRHMLCNRVTHGVFISQNVFKCSRAIENTKSRWRGSRVACLSSLPDNLTWFHCTGSEATSRRQTVRWRKLGSRRRTKKRTWSGCLLRGSWISCNAKHLNIGMHYVEE